MEQRPMQGSSVVVITSHTQTSHPAQLKPTFSSHTAVRELTLPKQYYQKWSLSDADCE
jgi:hypothetical protein